MNTTNPWHTKEWKEKRAETIKDKCERCGSSESPLVAQHTWHPPPSDFIFRYVTNTIYSRAVKEGKSQPVEELLKPLKDTHTVPVCPSCDKQSFSERKTMSPKYRCPSCTTVFDTPSTRFNYKHPEVREITSQWYKDMYQQHKETIQKVISRLQQAYHERYMSMKDVITCCQKCAFLEDKKGKILCVSCKKNYHPKRFATCWECNKDDKIEQFFNSFN